MRVNHLPESHQKRDLAEDERNARNNRTDPTSKVRLRCDARCVHEAYAHSSPEVFELICNETNDVEIALEARFGDLSGWIKLLESVECGCDEA
jgi:hypothetical protein